MSHYARHIFFCLNQRDNGADACSMHNAQAGFDRCKMRIKEAGLSGVGQVRVNKAGCLDRCAGGPVAAPASGTQPAGSAAAGGAGGPSAPPPKASRLRPPSSNTSYFTNTASSTNR